MAVTVSRASLLFNDSNGDTKVSPGDTLLTHILIKNTNGTPITGVTVNDTLDSHTTYVAGSTVVTIGDQYTGLVGNTPITLGASEGVLANDYHFDGPNAGTNTGLTVTTVEGVAIGSPITIHDAAAPATVAGTVDVHADGSFTFTPATGYVGTAAFTYTDSDGSGTVGSGTVTLTVSGEVWYVDSSYAGANGASDGSYLKPFTSFANLNGAGDVDNPGDTIVVHGSVSGANGNLTLEAGQKLYGDAAFHQVNDAYAVNGVTHNTGATTITSGSGTSSMSAIAGNIITLSTNNTIDGVSVSVIAGGAGIADNGGSVTTAGGTLTIANTSVSGGGQAVSITHGGNLAASFTSIGSIGGASAVSLAGTASSGTGLLSGSFSAASGIITGNTGKAFAIGNSGTASSGGTINVSYGGSISNTATGAIDVENKTGGTTTFSGDVTYNGTTGTGIAVNANGGGTVSFTGQNVSLTATSGTGVNLTNNTGATVTFNPTAGGNGLDVNATTGAGIVFTGGGTLNIQGTGNSVTTTTGHVLDFANGSIGAGNVSFASLTATAQVLGNAISLNNIDNNSFSGGTVVIHGASGDGIAITGGSTSAITFGNTAIGVGGGAIGSDGISVTSNTGSNVTFNGTLAITTNAGLSQGINIDTATGTVAFTGTSKSITTSSGDAIHIANNGAAVSFTGGGLTATSTSGDAIDASGTTPSATNALTISGNTNQINATNGMGVKISGVQTDVTLAGVKVTNATTDGIYINNGGTTAASKFVIQGTASAANNTLTADATNVSSSVDDNHLNGTGIYLNNIGNVDISKVTIAGNWGNFGIRGDNVYGFGLHDSTLSGNYGNSNGADEDAIRFGTGAGSTESPSGTTGVIGTATFDGNTIGGGYEDNLDFYVYGSNTTVLNIKDNTTSGSQAIFNVTQNPGTSGSGNDNIFVRSGDNSTLTVNIDGIDVRGAHGDQLQIVASDNTTQHVTVKNSTFNNNFSAATSGNTIGGDVYIGGGGSTATYHADFTIDNNTFKGAKDTAVQLIYGGATQVVSGTFTNNTIGTPSGGGATLTDGTGSLNGNGLEFDIVNQSGNSASKGAIRIQGNQIYDWSNLAGIALYATGTGSGTGTELLEATILNNTIAEGSNSALNGALGGIYAWAGSKNSSDAGTIGLNISGNTITAPNTAADIYLDQYNLSSVSHYNIPGYSGATGGATASTNLASFWTTTSPNTLSTAAGAYAQVDANGTVNITHNAFTLGVPLLVTPPPAADTATPTEEKPGDTQTVTNTDGGTSAGAGSTDATATTGTTDSGTTTTTPAAPTSTITHNLTQADLDQMVQAAIHRWELAGATPEQIAAMKAVSVSVSDISGLGVGDSTPGHILVSSSGAGYGWFIDATPDDDSEFEGTGTELTAAPGTMPYGHVDLLTVLEHELGHQIGLLDDYNSADAADLMYGFVNAGERRLASAGDVAHATGTPVDHESFVLSTVSLASLAAGNSVDVSFRSTVDNFAAGTAPALTGTSTVNYTGLGSPLTASETTNSVNTTRTDSGGTVTTNALAEATLTLGNLVFKDNDKDGQFGAGDTGINGVTVKLYVDSNSNGVYDAGTDTLVATTTTAGGGLYSFTGLAAGDYLVVIPAANFASGQPLNALVTHTGALDPDNNVDNDNNGAFVGSDVASQAITLALDTETTNGAGNDTNNTLDFGFQTNTPPTANADTLTATDEDTPHTYAASDFIGNDSDPDGDGFSITSVTNGAHGTAVLNNDGTVTYTPDADYNGSDSFTYTITDTHGATGTASASVTVNAVNDPVHTAGPGAATFLEDSSNTSIVSAGGTALSISDVDAALAPAGVYEVTLSATHGTLTLTTLTGITFSVGDGTADGAMTFHGTLADINTALASAKYTPDGNYAGAATISIGATDTYGNVVATGSGTATSDGQDINVTVTGVNDRPAAQDESATFNDTTTYHFTANDFTAHFSDPYDNPANTPLNVIITSLPSTGSLEYNGVPISAGSLPYTVSIADITADKLTYVPVSLSGGSDYSFHFEVQDNGGIANGGEDTTYEQTFTMHVQVSDFAPVLDLDTVAAGIDNNASYTEQAAPTILASGLSLTDSDDTDLTGATVSIGTGFIANADYLTVNGATSGTFNGISYSYDATTGILSFTGTGTVADYQSLLQQIGFESTTDAPGTSRDISWTATDGTLPSTTAHTSIAVTPVNDAPALIAQTADQHVNEDNAVNFSVASAFTDPDGDSLTYSATLGDGSPLPGWLSFDTTTATFTGTPPQDYNGTIALKVTASDGTLGTPETFNLIIDPVNDNPVMNATGTSFTYTENDPAHAFTATLAVSDVDNANFNGGQLVIADASGDTGDSIGLGSDPDISFNSGTGEVSYQGNVFGQVTQTANGYTIDLNSYATPAAIQALIADLTFSNTSDNPIGGDHAVTFTLTDGSGGTASFTDHINVVPVNDAPTIAGLAGDTVSFTENDPAVYTDADVNGLTAHTLVVPGPGNALVTDPDSADFAGGSLVFSISAGAIPTEDRVGFVGFNSQTAGAISFSGSNVYYGNVLFATSSGTLTSKTYAFNANATPQMVTALIHQLVYIDTSDNPNTGDRTLRYVLTDGDGGSTTVTTTVHVVAVNDAPVNAVPGAQAVNEDATLVFDSAHSNAITVSDLDVQGGNITATVSVLHGTVTLGSTLNVTASNNGTGTVTVTGTQANVNAALSGLSYQPSTNYNGPDTLTILTSDNGNTGTGGAKTDSDTVAITVNPMNDQPVVTPVASAIETEQTAVVLNPSWSASDVDLDAKNGGNGDYAGASIVMARTGGANAQDVFGFSSSGATFTVSGGNLVDGSNNVFATFSTSGGTLQINFTSTSTPATTALVNNVLDHIQYTNTSDAPPSSAQITYTFNDGAPGAGQGTVVSSNNLATGVINVTINAVDDAPVNSVPLAQTISEDGSRTFSAGNANAITVSDVDLGAGNITVTLTVGHGSLALGTTNNVSATGNGTGTVQVTGTAANVNTALDGLVYTPNANFNGDDTIHIVTGDNGNTGSGGPLSDTDDVIVHVTAVNDAPVASGSATAPTIDEDTPSATGDTVASLFGANFSDATDQVPGGSSANGFAGVAVTANGSSGATGHWQYWNGASWVDISTSVSPSSALLLAASTPIRFNPAANYSGQAPTLTVHLIDDSAGAVVTGGSADISGVGATGGTTSYSAGTVDLHETISDVNDPPVNSVPGGQALNEDATLTFSSANSNAITISDSDAGSSPISVTLVVSHGTLTLGSTLNVTASNNGTGTVTVTGSQANVNAALNGLVYHPSANYNGSDTLVVLTSDNGNTGSGGAQIDTDTVALTINPVNDQPSIASSPTVSAIEQTPVVVNPNLTVADVDLDARNNGQGDYGGASFLISASNSPNPEDTFLFDMTGATFTVSGNNLQSGGLTFATFTVSGGLLNISFNSSQTAATTALVNNVLGHIAYENTSDTPPASETLTYVFVDGAPGGGQGSGASNFVSKSVVVNITAVDDAPVNHVPGAQTINEDASQTFSAANSNAITVSDVDVGAGNVTVTLTVGHGILTLGSTANVTATGNGSGSVQVTGTVANVNAALDGLVYAPASNFNGDDMIHVVTSDNGNTGTGGPLTDTDDVTVHVTAVNDAPTVINGGTENAPAIDEDMPSAAGYSVSSLFASHYSDAADQVTGGSSAGAFSGIAITGNASSGATGQWQYWNGAAWVDVGAVSDASALTLSPTTAIRFNPAQDYNGAAPALTVHLADNTATITDGAHIDLSGLGATGGTTPWSTGTVALSETINAVDDAPVNHVPGTQTVAEDASLTFSSGNANAITVSDVDTASGSVTVTLTAAHGTLTLGGTTNLVVGGNGTGSVQLTGTLADVNAGLQGTVYAPNANYNGQDTIGVFTSDNGNTGSGGPLSDTDQITVNVTAVNDAPVVVNGSTETAPAIDEDTPSAAGYTVSSLFGSHYSDATDEVPGGSSAGAFTGIAITGNASSGATGQWQYWNGASWVDVGAVSDASALTLAAGTAIRFNPAQDYNGTAPALTVHLADNTATITDGAHIDLSGLGATGGTSPWSSGTVALSETINAIDDGPVNHVPGGQTFNEDSSQTFSAGSGNAITVSDVDAASGNVTVTLSVQHGTLTLGSTANVTATGDGSGTVQVTGTVADVNAALDGLVYAPAGNFNGDDAIHIVSTDNGNTGSGGPLTDTDDVALHVTAVNDAPTVTGSTATAPAIDEDTPSTTGDTASTLFAAYFSDATDQVAGGSSANGFAGVAVTTNGSSNATGHWQYWNGASWIDIPTTASDSSAFLLAASTPIRFNPAQDYNGAAPDLIVHLVDDSAGAVTTGSTVDISGAGNGGTTPYSAGTVTLAETVNPVNDAPVVDLNGSDPGTTSTVSYTDGQQQATAIAPNATVTDVDSGNYGGGTLTLAFTANGTADDLLVIGDHGQMNTGDISASEGSIYYQFGYITATGDPNNPYDYTFSDIRIIGTYTGGSQGDPLVVSLTADASPTVVANLLADIGYENASNTPGSLARTVTVTLQESDGTTSTPALVKINVTDTDLPPTAQDDQVATDEATPLVIAVTANDNDPDGPPPAVMTINGNAISVGQTITLPSGAKLTLNADGTLTYDPNHQFDTLTSPNGGETGAVNTDATDSFTYSIQGGSTATVQVQVTGVANAGDHLEGDSGNNVITGTPHFDYFDFSQGGDDSGFGLGGNDAFFFGGAYNSADKVDGGAGNDVVGLQGNYTGGNAVTILGGNMVNVETLNLMSSTGGPVGYDVTWQDGNLANGQRMTVYAGNLKSGENDTFNGSAETHGYFIMYGGAGDDHFTGGSGNDGFFFGPNKFNATDTIDGGGGSVNQIGLDGSYTFSAASPLGTLGGNFTNIQTIVLYTGDPLDQSNPYPNVFHIETNDNAVASGQLLTIYGALVLTDFTFNGSAETDGAFRIVSGIGNDTLIGGAGNDIFFGNLGADTMTGGGGNNTYVYNDVAQSAGNSADRITDFHSGDIIDLSGIDANTGLAGDQAFTFIGSNSFDGQAGELRAVFDAAHNVWTVEVDVDGDQHADMSIVLATTGGHIITASDFNL